MNEMEDIQGGAEGIELPDVDLDDAGEGVAEGGGNRIVFAIVVVLMLGFQAVSSHFLLKEFVFDEPPKPKPEKEVGGSSIGEIFPMEGFIVNPKESRGSRHLLVDINLEAPSTDVVNELTKLEPVIRDNINTFLAAQRYDVLTDITMRDKIRKRILEIVNYHITEGRVEEAYFVRYVVQ